MENHFFDAVAGRADGDATLLSVPGGERLTYAEMRRRAAAMAGALAALGVSPGDRVAAQIEKSAEGLILYVATLHAGAIFLPLNTAYTASEVGYFLRDAEPKVTVCDPSRRDAVAPLAAEVGGTVETLDAGGRGSLRDKAEAGDGDRDPAARGPDDLAAILYTSGTTGRSKGAMLTHGNLVSNAEALVRAWRFSSADCLLHALPIYHIHGLFVACNVVMASGASMIFMPKFDAGAALAELPKSTTMMGVPTFYTRLLDRSELTEQTTKGMRLFVSGSAPLLEETHRAWRERTGHAILERYGMTETNMNCANPYDGERRPGTVGFPVDGVAIRIVDPQNGGEVAPGEVGSIEVRGPNVFKGYWRNPEKTAVDLRSDGFFITGDIGRFDADGYLHIVGRDKDLVISGGFNVYPKEVELEIDAIDGVLESAVVGLPHRDFGEGVAAIVVPQPGARLEEADIKQALQGRLASFKQPKRVLFAEELPRNAMGKIQKNTLRETYKDVFASR